jgi:hypothetical protein
MGFAHHSPAQDNYEMRIRFAGSPPSYATLWVARAHSTSRVLTGRALKGPPRKPTSRLYMNSAAAGPVSLAGLKPLRHDRPL